MVMKTRTDKLLCKQVEPQVICLFMRVSGQKFIRETVALGYFLGVFLQDGRVESC